MRKSILALATVAAFTAAPAMAAIDTYVAFLNGANEAPGPGDPDGFGVATLLINNVANTISWSMIALNIEMPLTGAHIHAGAAGAPGPVIVNFGGSLIGADLFDADLASINPANAANFYVNLHTTSFGGGAIRGQLQYVGSATNPIPEPGTYALMLAGLGIVGAVARRRKG